MKIIIGISCFYLIKTLLSSPCKIWTQIQLPLIILPIISFVLKLIEFVVHVE